MHYYVQTTVKAWKAKPYQSSYFIAAIGNQLVPHLINIDQCVHSTGVSRCIVNAQVGPVGPVGRCSRCIVNAT